MTTEDFRNQDDETAAEAGRSADEAVTGRDGGPYDADDAEAADGLTATPEQAKNYEDMIEKGAALKGEGAAEV